MNTTPPKPPANPSPGAWLAAQMDRRDMNARSLAIAMNVADKTVYEWRGDRGTISEERIPRLAEVLGVSEIEARRGLGYWVPDGEVQPANNTAELEEIIQDLTKVLERFRRWRRESD